MKYLQRSMSFLAIFTISIFAHATLVSNLEDVTNGGVFFGTVTFADNGTNTVNITAEIADPINAGLTEGDILGLWFDFANFGSLSGTPTLSGATVESYAYGENSVGVSPFSDNNVALNGGQIVGNWDLAIQVGVNGSSGGFNQILDFDLMIAGLDESMFADQRVGMRVQSIEGGDGIY